MSNARKLADNLPSIGQLAGRNLVINGNMTVAQRTTGISGETAGGYKTVDRMYTNASGATYNQSQETVTVGGETGLPAQFTKYLRHNVTTGNNWSQIYHKIEDVSLVPEGTATLSFYAKGTSPNAGLTFYAWQNFGSGGSGEVGISSITQTVTLTSTWQRFIVPITIPSMAGKTMGTGSHFYFGIGQGGSTSTNAWTLDITGLQLETGSKATPFEHEPAEVNLAKCQRYYYKLTYNKTSWMYPINTNNANGYRRGTIHLPVTMRTTPTYTAGLVHSGGTSGVDGGVWVGPDTVGVYVNGISGESDYAYLNALTADAELQMNITKAKYHNSELPNSTNIKATIDGEEMFVPIVDDNRYYVAIQAWVADGNTIDSAD